MGIGSGLRDWEIYEELKAGRSVIATAEVVGVHPRTVRSLLVRTGGIPVRRPVGRSTRFLSLDEREEISRGLARDEPFGSIARRLGRSCSTVSREVARNGGRGRYRAQQAERDTAKRSKRPKAAKLACNPKLKAAVEAGLEKYWSPEQISMRLKVDFVDDPEMRVSHETIYQSLFVQSRGALRKELTVFLRSKRVQRSQSPATFSGRISDKVGISKRPPEVADRAVPGHWEGDMLMGKSNLSQIGTLVERTTRYLLLVRLGNKKADQVCDALVERMQTLPDTMKQSLTWDQGTEMANHLNFTLRTDIDVYFCDPQSPWQRGTNENTNGLLRQYFPKGTDLSQVTDEQLRQVEASLNDRPRKTLEWQKPIEEYTRLVATTA